MLDGPIKTNILWHRLHQFSDVRQRVLENLLNEEVIKVEWRLDSWRPISYYRLKEKTN
ncbi:hypothetical protein KAU88_06650 [Candidatus Bathyarchaeota archaeon]|nr:hypothetical protein [Candidatus Bathyarchaeota archaeon]